MSIDTKPMKAEAKALMTMQLWKAYDQVFDFNVTAGILPNQMVVYDAIKLREKLLLEEIGEYRTAVVQKDAVEVVDALVDILYVALGVYVLHGLKPADDSFEFNIVGGSVIVNDISYGMQTANVMQRLVIMYSETDMKQDSLDALLSVLNEAIKHHGVSKFWEYFETIHQNNMSKFDTNEKDAIATQQKYAKEDFFTERFKVGGLYVVKREDGKVLKSVKYKPVTLTL